MINAYNINLKNYFNSEDGLPDNPKVYDWICPNCKKKVIHVKESYNFRIEHFRHYSGRGCEFEPETPEHIEMKKYFYKNIPKFNKISQKFLEHKIGNQIADVFFELDNGKKIAIECQNSHISLNDCIKRTEGYDKNNVYVLWVLNDGSFYKRIHYNSKDSEERLRFCGISLIEKKLHQIYRGRVYYLNLQKKLIYPIYYAPYFEMRENYYLGYFYNYYFKTTRSPVFGEIPNLRLLCVDYDYKIARFMDKNMKTLCSNIIKKQIYNFIESKNSVIEGFFYRNKHLEIEDFIIFNYSNLMASIDNKYGFYLPHQILVNFGFKPINRIRNGSKIGIILKP